MPQSQHQPRKRKPPPKSVQQKILQSYRRKKKRARAKPRPPPEALAVIESPPKAGIAEECIFAVVRGAEMVYWISTTQTQPLETWVCSHLTALTAPLEPYVAVGLGLISWQRLSHQQFQERLHAGQLASDSPIKINDTRTAEEVQLVLEEYSGLASILSLRAIFCALPSLLS